MNTEISGYCNEGISVPRVVCHRLTGVTDFPGKGEDLTELSEVPGTGTDDLQNLQKFWVL